MQKFYSINDVYGIIVQRVVKYAIAVVVHLIHQALSQLCHLEYIGVLFNTAAKLTM